MMASTHIADDYVHDSLGRRIAFGFADFLFGEDPKLTLDDEGQQKKLDEACEENRMGARLHRAERMIVSEGEAWWKLHLNEAIADCALLTWTSRRYVVPLFYGDRVLACAFVTERARAMEVWEKDSDKDDLVEIVYRHAEVHAQGVIHNLLYRGLDDELGYRVELTKRPETAAYVDFLEHGLPMLAGRIVNDLDEDDSLGVSDYDDIEDLLFALNDAATIAKKNTKLTAVDRIAAAGRFTQQDGSFDASMQVFTVEADGGTLGEGDSKPPIVQIEKRYDAEPLWLHIDKLVRSILRNVGLVAEFIGDDGEGQAISGVAIRLRFIPTTNAAEGKMREWKHDLPRILALMLALGEGAKTVGKLPAIEFGEAVPEDPTEVVNQVSLAMAAEAMSRKTAVGELHPDWDDEAIDDELALIEKDLGSAPAPAPEPKPEPEPVA